MFIVKKSFLTELTLLAISYLIILLWGAVLLCAWYLLSLPLQK